MNSEFRVQATYAQGTSVVTDPYIFTLLKLQGTSARESQGRLE